MNGIYTGYFDSPIGKMLLASDDTGLIGAWYSGQKFEADLLSKPIVIQENETIRKAKEWLNCYFEKKENDIVVPYHMIGTDFQKEVWSILLSIPYGKTMTYGEIAQEVAKRHHILKMSSRAVGQAVGRNHLSIFIPCHRVVGVNNKLTGYAGGIERKKYLLALEKAI